MNWKNRLTNYNFWISIVSAVLLILQAFDISFDIAYINEIVTAVLGLLVVIGIINDPTKSSKNESNQTETNSNLVADAKNEQETNSDIESTNQTNTDNQIEENVIQESVQQQTEDIPNEVEDENNISDSSNDYEVLVNKIYSDLNLMKANLEKLYSSGNMNLEEKNFENNENETNIEENSSQNPEISENYNQTASAQENVNTSIDTDYQSKVMENMIDENADGKTESEQSSSFKIVN